MQVVFDSLWMTPFRAHVMVDIDITSSAGCQVQDCLSQWSVLMPDQVLRRVVSQILMPKLREALQSWNAKSGRPLQEWLTPWCELIGKRNMKQLFEVIKGQLAPLFTDKKLFKTQALAAFTPWISVLESKEVISFANRFIYPKLTSLVKRLEVDPSDQKLWPLELLFGWTRVLPQPYSTKQVNCIMRDYFLPKLIQTLQSWLDIINKDDGAEVEEIFVWYTGWKKFLLESENTLLIDRARTEEVFYLMLLLVEEKLA